jgi:predicted nucleic acid-binding protein
MACADAADSAHQQTCRVRDRWLEQGGQLVSTDYVIDETLTLIRMRINLTAAEAWWKQVDGSNRIRWETIHEGRSEKARGLFFRYADKDFSFTDCTSFVVMRELRIKGSLTTDRHFARMGFTMHPSR